MIVQSDREQSGGLSSEIKFYDIQVRVQAFEQSGTLPLGCMWYQDVLLMWILKFYEHKRQKKGEQKSQHTHTCIHMEKQHMVYYSGVKCTGGFRLSVLHTAHSWATQTESVSLMEEKRQKTTTQDSREPLGRYSTNLLAALQWEIWHGGRRKKRQENAKYQKENTRQREIC